MIIAVDFDLTLSLGEYPNVGPLAPGAKDALEQMKADGHEVIIWTSRNGVHVQSARKFLEDNGVPFDCINENLPRILEEYHGKDNRKVYADVYIDDKNIPPMPVNKYGEPDWSKLMGHLQNHEMYYE